MIEIDLKTTDSELCDQFPDRRAGDLGLSKEEISALERSIDIPFQTWREFPPLAIPVLIFRRRVSLFPNPMEGYLIEAAQNSDKPIISLETMEERVSYEIKYADELNKSFRQEIAKEILSPGYLPKRCRDREEIFESGDISAYRKFIRDHIIPGTSERDKKMFERSVLHIKEESCTVATGIVHMIRKGGLLDMYSNAGIEINRLGYDRDKTQGQKQTQAL